MGKNLKFPARQKFKPEIKEKEMESAPVSDEEHEKRVKMLRDMGLIK
jgi:hypothetical protein